jgi:1-phosphofructokinase family hexose kinase
MESVTLGHVHRSEKNDVRGGGKGANVARALGHLGVASSVMGLAGGRTGAAVLGLLEDEGLAANAVLARGESRSCLTVITNQGVTVFNESGSQITPGVWERYEEEVARRLSRAKIFICSGSFPPGSPDDGAARLVRLARSHGCTTVCDTARTQLTHVLSEECDLVKPNLAEAAEVLGGKVTETVDEDKAGLTRAGELAEALVQRGPRAVLVSAGSDGAALASSSSTHLWSTPAVRVVNPVGAGDCLVAGIASKIASGESLTQSVPYGIAVAAAGCETFAAGEVVRARADALFGLVVEEKR